MIEKLLHILHLKTIIRYLKTQKNIRAWDQRGRTPPTPHAIKRRELNKYIDKYKTKIMIETGTYNGAMVKAMKNKFGQIYSIELDSVLAQKAQNKFQQYNHITILEGDSGKLIKKILDKIDQPVLFWLDAHYSGGTTARGDVDTPIVTELKHILNHGIDNHVILIDDAREFVGQGDYPKLEIIKKLFKDRDEKWSIEVKYDIIRITKEI